jgi:glycosyltransferase 2 family protein
MLPATRLRWLMGLGVAVGAACLYYALRGVNLSEFAAALKRANLWVALPFLAILFGFYWIKTVRWAQLLAPFVATRAGTLFPAVMIGYAGNALLPMSLGDIARASIAARQLGAPTFAVLVSIAIERAFDLAGILLVLIAALVAFEDLPRVVVTTGYWLAAAIGAVVLCASFYVFFTSTVVRLARWCTGWLPETVSTRLLGELEKGAAGAGIVRRPRLAAGALATSLLQWVFMWMCVWLSLYALHVEVPFGAALVVLVLTVVGITLPSSPGYFGNIQLAYVLALKPFGIDPGSAIAASLFFHALAYPSVVIVGLTYLRTQGARFQLT